MPTLLEGSMKKTVIGTASAVLVALVVTGACSKDETSSGNSSTGGQSEQGGGTGGGPTGGAGGAGNSSPAGGTSGANSGQAGASGLEEVWIEASNLVSCDDVCANEGYDCAAVCGDDDATAADTLYTYTSASGFNVNEQRAFAVCDEPVDQVLTLNGDDYLLVTLRCCCLAPPVQRLDGDPANPMSCNDLCAASGLVCYPETNWDGLATTGLMSTYTNSTGVRYIPGDCDEVPALSVNRIGEDEPLTAFRCGCVP